MNTTAIQSIMSTSPEIGGIGRVGLPRGAEHIRAKSNPEHRTNALVEHLRALCHSSPLDDLAIVRVLSTMPVEGAGGVAVLWQYARQALNTADFDRIHFCAWCSLCAYDPLVRALRWWRAPGGKENPALMEIAPVIVLRYLNNADLRAVRFDGFDLDSANLTGANLTGANLTGADLARANLTGANLTGANLTGADLARANLARANLAHANLAHANLARANLARANLAHSNLAHSNLARANLNGANLTAANLYGAAGLDEAFGYTRR